MPSSAYKIALLSVLNLSLSHTALGFLPGGLFPKQNPALHLLPVGDPSCRRALNNNSPPPLRPPPSPASRISRHGPDRRPRQPSLLLLSGAKDGGNNNNNNNNNNNARDECFPRHLIDSLDLTQIIEEIARHTATRRGYDALLSTVQQKQKQQQNYSDRRVSLLLSNLQQRERYGVTATYYEGQLGPSSLAPIAKSFHDVRSEYALVEEATLTLSSTKKAALGGDDNGNDNGNDDNDNNDNDNDAPWNDLTYPPLYGEYSGPYDIDTIPQTDDDEWLYRSAEEYTAENVLQAEQVIKRLLEIREWSRKEATRTWAPTLAQMGSAIDNNNDNNDDENNDDENNGGNHDDKRVAFRLVEPCPDRSEWLPAISRYEQKGWDEGRTTKLSCWEAI